MSEGRLSAERANRLTAMIVDRFWEKVAMVVQEKLIDGYPPFTEPETPSDVYHRLMAARDAGDPAYWQNPQAQAQLAQLAQRFGTPTPTPQPFGVAPSASPAAVLSATEAANKLGVQ